MYSIGGLARCARGVVFDPTQVEHVVGRHFTSDLSKDRVVVKINPLGVEMPGRLVEQEKGHQRNGHAAAGGRYSAVLAVVRSRNLGFSDRHAGNILFGMHCDVEIGESS